MPSGSALAPLVGGWEAAEEQPAASKNADLAEVASESSVSTSASASANLSAALVRLSSKIREDRSWREGLEARLTNFEARIGEEKQARQGALQQVQSLVFAEIENLASRIEARVKQEADALSLHSSRTEAAIASLAVRVEEGLAKMATREPGEAAPPPVAPYPQLQPLEPPAELPQQRAVAAAVPPSQQAVPPSPQARSPQTLLQPKPFSTVERRATPQNPRPTTPQSSRPALVSTPHGKPLAEVVSVKEAPRAVQRMPSGNTLLAESARSRGGVSAPSVIPGTGRTVNGQPPPPSGRPTPAARPPSTSPSNSVRVSALAAPGQQAVSARQLPTVVPVVQPPRMATSARGVLHH